MTLVTDFDQPHYARINKARADWLNRILDNIKPKLETANDVACGAGYFSNALAQRGMKVTGFDLQECNLETCRTLYPDSMFEQVDLDGRFELPEADFTLIFGLLYHLQSPYLTISQIAPSIGKVGAISTMVNPDDGLTFKPYYEANGPTQNHASDVSLVPSESAVKECFAFLGFHVYQPGLVDHEQWIMGRAFPKAKRVSFVVSREPLETKWSEYQKTGFHRKWN